jgi:F-type H+-transporting ATPase subunit b
MEGPGLISPNLATFLLTIVNIGILYFLLRAILFKPVTKFMEARAKSIQDSINQAEKNKLEAKQLLEQYEAKLSSAEVKAGEIIKAARESAAQETQRIIANGKNSLELMMENGRKQIELEHTASLLKFKAEAVMLIMAASAKLIGRDLRNEDNQHFVQLLMESLTAESSANEFAASDFAAKSAVQEGNA